MEMKKLLDQNEKAGDNSIVRRVLCLTCGTAFSGGVVPVRCACGNVQISNNQFSFLEGAEFEDLTEPDEDIRGYYGQWHDPQENWIILDSIMR
jgi:hypothetical protein